MAAMTLLSCALTWASSSEISAPSWGNGTNRKSAHWGACEVDPIRRQSSRQHCLLRKPWVRSNRTRIRTLAALRGGARRDHPRIPMECSCRPVRNCRTVHRSTHCVPYVRSNRRPMLRAARLQFIPARYATRSISPQIARARETSGCDRPRQSMLANGTSCQCARPQ